MLWICSSSDGPNTLGFRPLAVIASSIALFGVEVQESEQEASFSCRVPVGLLLQAVLLAERHSSEAAQEICTAGMRHWPWGQLPTKLVSLTNKAAAGIPPPASPS